MRRMNLKKTVCVLLAGLMLLAIFAGCAKKEPPAEPEQTPTEELKEESKEEPKETQEEQSKPEPEQQPEEEPVELPRLSALTVDGEALPDFDPEVYAYTVTIPDGRPKLPQVSAEAESGVSVQVAQAAIPDSAKSGTAVITVTKDGAQSEYSVTFEKSREAGFRLQYEDRYAFTPDYTLQSGESFRFSSSDSGIVTVSEDGQLRAKKVSDKPVTVTATVNGNVVDELVIDCVIKAPLNIFVIIGQSNAFGWHDVPEGYSDYYAYANKQKALCDAPAPGTVWCDDIANAYDDYSFSGIYDLSKGRSGFSPALGKYWYELTGEKTLMLQTAIGSTPIETWVPDPALKFFGLDCYKQTVERFNYYRDKFTADNSNFEIGRVYAFWLQGETCQEFTYIPETFRWALKNYIPNYAYVGDWVQPSAEHPLMTAEQYSDYFMQMYEGLTEDIGLAFLGVIPVRAMTSVSSEENVASQQLTDLVAPRAAQYALNCTENGNISFVTRVSEIGRMESYPDQNAEGWGYMGCSNIHMNQRGYNAVGKDIAENLAARFFTGYDRAAKELLVLKENGKDTFEEGEELTVIVGEGYQTASVVLPIYTDTPIVSYIVEDPTVCTVDAYGRIHGNADAVGRQTTVTFRCEEAGMERSILVTVVGKETREVTYEWNFDNGDLTEKNGLNDLTLAAKSKISGEYFIANGKYVSTNSKTNFRLDSPIRISRDFDWTIEWRGMLGNNSALLGTAGNWTNFLYLAYMVPFEVENPFRIVGADGTAIMIPYGDYASYNTSSMNTWRAEYHSAENTLTLYLNDTITVGSASLPDGWYAEFTNLFGSYFEGVDVDFMGAMDWIRVTTVGDVILR